MVASGEIAPYISSQDRGLLQTPQKWGERKIYRKKVRLKTAGSPFLHIRKARQTKSNSLEGFSFTFASGRSLLQGGDVNGGKKKPLADRSSEKILSPG